MKLSMASFCILILSFCFLLFQTFASSPPDFSNARDPAIFLDIVDLHATREAQDYGSHILPEYPGLIELRCSLRLDSLQSSIPDRSMKATSLSWVLPNGKIIEEHRAHQRSESTPLQESIHLAITEFKPEEDAGLYTCMMLLDGEPSEFHRSINIPDLDGSPILQCNMHCTRNQDKKCQILENYSIRCEALGLPQPDMFCGFEECDEEEQCHAPVAIPAIAYGFGRSSNVYQRASRLVADELALRSGRYSCVAANGYEKQSSFSIFVPVSAAQETSAVEAPIFVPPPAPSLLGPPIRPGLLGPQGPHGLPHPLEPIPPGLPPQAGAPKPLFLGKISTTYPAIGENLVISCWTYENSVTELQWTFWNASSPNKMEVITNDSHADFQLINDHNVSGGHLSQILLQPLTLDHGGFYVCSLIRSGVKLSQDFVVETYRWADEADMNKDLEVTKTVKESITMRCTVTTTESDPGYRWWKDEAFLEESVDGRVQFSPNKESVTINSLETSDSGVYTCKSYPLFSLGVRDLKGKSTLTVTETEDRENHVQNLNKAISSLSSIQEVLTEMADDLALD